MMILRSNKLSRIAHPRRFAVLNMDTLIVGILLRSAVFLCFSSIFFAPLTAAQEKNAQQDREPLAILSGRPITEDQLPAAEQTQLQKMMQQVFAVHRRALETVLDQKLLEAEAKKKGVSVEDLLKEASSKVADPTEDQVRAYYEAHQGQINKPIEEARDSLRQALKVVAIREAQSDYVRGLMQQSINNGELVVLMHPPKLDLPPDPTRLKGDPNAPITIVEFSDFGCPSCEKVESTLNAVLTEYPGKIKVAYRDFLSEQKDPQTLLATEASRCAAEQGKFWEYHDLLFANVAKQSHEDLIGYAHSLKLDDNQFAGCLNASKYDPQIAQDLRLGFNAGLIVPPGFFINGLFLEGPQSRDTFKKIIDKELNEAQQPSKSTISAKQD